MYAATTSGKDFLIFKAQIVLQRRVTIDQNGSIETPICIQSNEENDTFPL